MSKAMLKFTRRQEGGGVGRELSIGGGGGGKDSLDDRVGSSRCHTYSERLFFPNAEIYRDESVMLNAYILM